MANTREMWLYLLSENRYTQNSDALLEEGRGGGGLKKRCPNLWKKCPDCGYLWVKFFI